MWNEDDCTIDNYLSFFCHANAILTFAASFIVIHRKCTSESGLYTHSNTIRD